MTEETAPEQVILAFINGTVDAKLKPLAEVVTGLHAALVAIIGALHDRDSLGLDDAERALRGTLERMSGEMQQGQAGETLRRLLQAIESMRQGRPPVLH